MQVICPDGVYLVALARNVDTGEVVDVPDDVAESLIDQGWPVPKPDEGGPTKAELVAIAEDLGVELKPSWTAKRIAQALEEHAQQPDPESDEPAAAEQED